ncbi:glyoxylate/hydroxypyruvate reductase A [Paracoccus sp. S-4012]|uniref:2-hydroxyacid dehydrogenase n=1 Tax=Paracoccus sp. S-4012 TaxID=2665648 RepID=UPI0012AF5156|nr:glyoxylate/hydroxypyruvate reductase A [Paracoccus sp. S-4012]MRX49597.1 glyoxylate/hydroxypyruvate reductase A [Paracoccus sp. S-4012]
MLTVLWAARPDRWPAWEAPLERELAGLARIVHEAPEPEAIDAIIYAPNARFSDFSPYTRAGLVQSLWAGVERIVGNGTLTQPLARMVDPGLTDGMVEYCLGWAMRFHLGMDRYAQDGAWRNALIPPLARERRVTVLGAGALGAPVARRLAQVGFDTAVWSASGREVEGLTVIGGEKGLPEALGRAEILVTLLPDTPETRDLLDSHRLAMLPAGAAIVNPGRGTLIEDAALIAALDSGQVGHAVLDVFRTEPLPPGHAFWSHPRVFVTPHIAAETRPSSAAAVVAENLRRLRDGRPFLHLVDRTRGY